MVRSFVLSLAALAAVPSAAFWFKKRPRRCAALFSTNSFDALITARQVKGSGAATWSVFITDEEREELCPFGQLNWHIHQFRAQESPADSSYRFGGYAKSEETPDVGAQCGGDTTGGHTDDSLKCGGASQARREGNCDDVEPADYSAACKEAQDNCEYGDISGKVGKISLDKVWARQSYHDTYLQDLKTYNGMSMVLHCCSKNADETLNCSPRVACANMLCF